MKRKALAWLLMLCMIFGSFPAYAFAGTGTPDLPTATVTKIKNNDLTFALNFQADEVTDEQLAFYDDWYADFELTVNKEVTFNANGGADGYLSGQYDAWSDEWVNVPFDDVTLEAGKSLKIMEYASELMGKPGLKYTYGEVYEFVKDFDCGVFFTEEFLAANPDLEVTLELRMYNPADESENYVIGETYVYTLGDVTPALPTATVTKIKNNDLTFALNFQADEVTDEQLAFYDDWYADFELTVNKEVTFNANGGADGYLSGQYDAWSDEWVNVPFDDVTLEAGKSLKIMEYASELMGKPGLKYTYGEVYEFVKDFDCGVYFTPEFLAENPDLEVTLELRMYNPADDTEAYTIGETYVYTLENVEPNLPTATVTQLDNDELTFALNFQADEVTDEQLAFYDDWYADFELTVNKEVTFNANGGADGYLSGQYDAWSDEWVNVPFDDVTLEAGKSLKIMEYASELMGKPGLKYTYGEVYEFVKDFDCGVYFTPEFLAENPDLEVTLELKMYNPADETESYTIGDTYTFTIPALPTATITEVENDDLTFALNFQADEVTDEQLAFYDDWYADFELTVNKEVTFNANGGADGYLSGQYDAWSENWVNVPFDDVTLEAGKSLKIMEYASEMMGKPGLKYTYGEVYEFVKDFDCGVFFTEEFLAANPDLEVTLELRMYNPEQEDINYSISGKYIFTLAGLAVAQNDQTKELYNDLQLALLDAQEGETVIPLRDLEVTMVTVPENVTLNLDGYTLTTSYMACFGHIVDNSDDNSGLLAVADSKFLIQEDNAQIPAKTAEGYRFIELKGFNEAINQGKFVFQPLFEKAAHEILLSDCDVTINARIFWTNDRGEARSQNFTYTDEFVKGFISSYNAATGKYSKMFTLLINNANINTLKCEAFVASPTKVEKSVVVD